MKQIHTIHHYLGTFFFGMFLIWFLSGFVMMYKSFPFLSQKEKIEGNEFIQNSANDLPHPANVFIGYQEERANSLRVNSILGEPVYHLITSKGELVSKFASTGESIKINKQFAILI